MRPIHVAVVVLVLAGCGDGDTSPSSPARGPFGAAPATVATTAPEATVTVAHGRHEIGTLDRASLGPRPRASTVPATVTPTATATIPATVEPAHRDLAADLATAVGSPASCIDTTTARTLHGRLMINVSATVTPLGGVTRATATGSSVPESVLTCMRDRVLNARLAAPIEGAPRTISTTLAFEVTTTDDETTTETPTWHQPGAVAGPGVVLPAGGAETARPTGSIAPDLVHPALGPSGRQEGTVAPDILLPARAQ